MQRHSSARTTGTARSIARSPASDESFVIGAFLIAGAAITIWMLCLPFLLGASLASLNAAHGYAAVSTQWNTSSRSLKGNRLTSTHVKQSGVAGVDQGKIGARRVMSGSSPPTSADQSRADRARVEAPSALKSEGKILVGCEPAFSKLVRAGNFARRCVTSIDTSLSFASADRETRLDELLA